MFYRQTHTYILKIVMQPQLTENDPRKPQLTAKRSNVLRIGGVKRLKRCQRATRFAAPDQGSLYVLSLDNDVARKFAALPASGVGRLNRQFTQNRRALSCASACDRNMKHDFAEDRRLSSAYADYVADSSLLVPAYPCTP